MFPTCPVKYSLLISLVKSDWKFRQKIPAPSIRFPNRPSFFFCLSAYLPTFANDIRPILQRSLYIFPDSQYAEHCLQELAGEESPEVALDAEKGDGIENEQEAEQKAQHAKGESLRCFAESV